MAKVKKGVAKCDCCGEEIVWRASDQGSLSYTCQHCDFRAFAPKFSDASKAIERKLGGAISAPEQEPKPVPKPAPKAKPAAPEPDPKPTPAPPKKSGSVWDQLMGANAQ